MTIVIGPASLPRQGNGLLHCSMAIFMVFNALVFHPCGRYIADMSSCFLFSVKNFKIPSRGGISVKGVSREI